ncbi:MAG TPA: hypothetical protein VNK92_07540, partial [Vicinamibacterales bacterium]|nr:hypothetical protein [Vicinamibacterales bacterium]
MSLLVVAEQRDGRVGPASWETVAAAQSVGGPLRIVVPGAGVTAAATELAAAEAAEVVALEHAALEPYTPDAYVAALAAFLQAEPPSLVFLPHTYRTRDFAPALAARIDRALVTDCIEVRRRGDALLFVRPMFQGKLHAAVEALGPAPHLVTIQVGVFRADAARRGSSP